MSLRILVVGKGTAPGRQVTNGHSLEFTSRARSDSGILSLEPYHFVFQHLSPANPEAADAIDEWINKGWRTRILGFSGGKILDELKSLDVPQLQGLSSRDSIIDLTWSAVPPDFSGDARELLSLLKPSRHEFLSAIAILCQGYLAVQFHKNKTDTVPVEAREALTDMGLDKIVDDINRELVNAGDASAATWWRQVFAGQRDETEKAIAHEWGVPAIGGCPTPIADLVASIYSDQPIGAKVVGGAYLAIAQKLRN